MVGSDVRKRRRRVEVEGQSNLMIHHGGHREHGGRNHGGQKSTLQSPSVFSAVGHFQTSARISAEGKGILTGSTGFTGFLNGPLTGHPFLILSIL